MAEMRAALREIELKENLDREKWRRKGVLILLKRF